MRIIIKDWETESEGSYGIYENARLVITEYGFDVIDSYGRTEYGDEMYPIRNFSLMKTRMENDDLIEIMIEPWE
jgi:hypothetical protein